tara:strand:- start:1892 stop:1993 length:102 start_codon:yes stop_codon:yes gene_type:complete
MTEEEFFRFIKRMEKQVWEDNFPEYEKEENDDE